MLNRVNPKDVKWSPRDNQVYESAGDRFFGAIGCVLGLHTQTYTHSDCGKYRVWYCTNCHKVLAIYKEYQIARPNVWIR